MTKTRMIYIAVLIVAVMVLIWEQADRSNREIPAPDSPNIAQQPPAQTEPPAVLEQPPSQIHKLVAAVNKTTSKYSTSFTPASARDIFIPSQSFYQAVNMQAGKDQDPPNHPDPRDSLCLAGILRTANILIGALDVF